MMNCKPVNNLMSKAYLLSQDMCPKTQNKKHEMFLVPYSNVVESLMYVMMCTRPTNCFTIGLVSRYQSNPIKEH